MQLSVNGQPVYAYTGGRPHRPEQPAVIMIHGAQNDHSVWILQSRHLGHHGFNVLAVDLPGHGRSAGDPLDSIEALADWVEALMDAAGLARAHLVGHSMGSLIALDLAGRRPQRVRSIALLGTAFPMKVSDALLGAAREDESRAFDMINRWSHLSLNHIPGCPGPGFSVYNQARRLMERQKPGVLHTDFSACNRYEAGLERAAQIACPVLVVIGQQDMMTPPKAARALAQALPEAQVVDIEGSGHALMAEQSDGVLRALRSFLNGRANV